MANTDRLSLYTLPAPHDLEVSVKKLRDSANELWPDTRAFQDMITDIEWASEAHNNGTTLSSFGEPTIRLPQAKLRPVILSHLTNHQLDSRFIRWDEVIVDSLYKVASEWQSENRTRARSNGNTERCTVDCTLTGTCIDSDRPPPPTCHSLENVPEFLTYMMQGLVDVRADILRSQESNTSSIKALSSQLSEIASRYNGSRNQTHKEPKYNAHPQKGGWNAPGVAGSNFDPVVKDEFSRDNGCGSGRAPSSRSTIHTNHIRPRRPTRSTRPSTCAQNASVWRSGLGGMTTLGTTQGVC